MSYILDALKRSERDRRLQQPPLSRSIHDQLANGAPAARMALPRGPLVVALFVALSVAAWLAAPDINFNLQFERASTPGDTSRTVAAPTVEPRPASLPAEPVPAAEPPAASPTRVFALWELPAAEQQYLGQFDIAMHVYSSDPAQRTILFNGLRSREGQDLGGDLRLVSIVEDGIVLDFKGRRVHLPAGLAW